VRVVGDLSANQGQQGLCLWQVLWRNREDILREHSEVGQFTRRKAAFVLFGKFCVGRSQRIGNHSLFPCQRFF